MHDISPTSPIRRAHAPLRHQVLDYLRQGIISGRLAPGSRLVERGLIDMMAVSRTVIREALRQLETEGLVANIPNKGPVVRELSVAEAKDLYAIRGVLVGLAARFFVHNADVGARENLQQALEQTAHCYKAGDPAKIIEAKNRFYEILVEGAGSDSLSTMLATLHARVARWRALGLSRLRAMFDAITKGDVTAAEMLAREETTHAAAEVVQLLTQADVTA
jgi:GntR family transcriptional regulator, trigonelline degradation regulator